MIEMNCLRIRLRNVFRPAVTLAASVLLLCTFPAVAGLSGAIGATGASHSLKETLAETTGLFGEMVSAFMDGDDETAYELMGEVAKTPGKLVKRAFPVLEAPQAVADKLKSATQRLKRFGETLTDARAALEVGRGGQAAGWSDATLLEGGPLPAPADTLFAAPNYESPAEVLAALTGGAQRTPDEAGAGPAASAWGFEQWVVARQEANPHCYGVVDLETLPPECFGPSDIETPATPPAAVNKVEAAPPAGGVDWATGDWTIAGDGWSGWDQSDLRYSEADRDAARVGVFAAECWGVYGVSKQSGLYGLMRERMQRNECPDEDTNRASSGDAAVPGDDGYLSALGDLAAKEEQARRLAEEQRRLEAEEREQQARLEAEARERERQARLEEERERAAQRAEQDRLDALEAQQQREYTQQALRNVTESLRGFTEQVNRTYGLGGTTGGSSAGRSCDSSNGPIPSDCRFDYNKRP